MADNFNPFGHQPDASPGCGKKSKGPSGPVDALGGADRRVNPPTGGGSYADHRQGKAPQGGKGKE